MKENGFSSYHQINRKNYELYNIHLNAKKEGIKYKKYLKKYIQDTNEIKKVYDIRNYNSDISRKSYIGEVDKNKRICRFCNKTNKEVSFKNEAHAISNALGNKTIILNEECDNCNNKFSSMESSLISYFKFDSLLSEKRTRIGAQKLKGKKFEISKEGKEFKFEYHVESRNEIKNLIKKGVKLTTNEKVIDQDIYRTLCKYFLSVIDKKHLKHFKETIKWINKEKKIDHLPPIAVLNPSPFDKASPKLMTNIRKIIKYELPHAVGEFTYLKQAFVFIVPLSELDESCFSNNQDFIKAFRFFKQYLRNPDWKFYNFANNKKKAIPLILKLKKI